MLKETGKKPLLIFRNSFYEVNNTGLVEQLDNLKGLLSLEHTYTHPMNGQKYKCYHSPKETVM